jgi:hypothetical protein
MARALHAGAVKYTLSVGQEVTTGILLKLQVHGDIVPALLKPLRPRALQVAWRFLCCMLVLHLYYLDRTWAQAPTAQTLGSLRAVKFI